jgi:hypothetical protein
MQSLPSSFNGSDLDGARAAWLDGDAAAWRTYVAQLKPVVRAAPPAERAPRRWRPGAPCPLRPRTHSAQR